MINKSLYKCQICGQEVRIEKPKKGPFPEKVKCKTLDCDGYLYRVIGNMITDVAKGKLGHSNNGYDIYGANQPSTHTPMSVKYGNQGRNTDYLDERY